MFLDLKLHDIGNTVEKGVESVARIGATFVTVHAYPQTMKAAVAARGSAGLRILAVTVLTSYDDADLEAAGYALGVSSLVARRAAQAREIGVDGLVCSAEEAAALRSLVGTSMVLVTPGIRPAGAAAGDQKRVMTPARAIAAGADYLVVGRPIVEAADPKSGRRGHRRGDHGRSGGLNQPGDEHNGEGILDCSGRRVRPRKLQGLCRRHPGRVPQVRRPLRHPRRPQRGDGGRAALAPHHGRVCRLRHRARRLQVARIRPTVKKLRQHCATVDLVVVEGYDGAQP